VIALALFVLARFIMHHSCICTGEGACRAGQLPELNDAVHLRALTWSHNRSTLSSLYSVDHSLLPLVPNTCQVLAQASARPFSQDGRSKRAPRTNVCI
jgi:hypothetical protein